MIREIRSDELSTLLALYQDLHTADDPLPPRAEIEALWQQVQGNAAFKYFGLYVDQKLVATCTLTLIPNFTRGCRPYGLIENVVTHRDFRRKGYGRAILAHALDIAWANNCYKVMLMTGRKDEATFRFYESAGFDRHAKQAFLAKPRKA